MYCLYLDDSGSTANQDEKYFILAGVCVFEHKIYWLRKYLDELANEIYPENPNIIEFHASEIFSGREEPWKSLKKIERVEIIKKVLKSLEVEQSKTPPVVFACAVHKDSFPKNDPVELAFEDICSRFEMYLNRIYHQSGKKESHRGVIILDKSTKETSLQKLAIDFRQIGTKWRTLNNMAEVPLFVDSKASRLIQLADHIAYAVFRRYQSSDLNYYNCIEGCFDSDGGKIHGLIHKQHYNPNCTCPACLR